MATAGPAIGGMALLAITAFLDFAGQQRIADFLGSGDPVSFSGPVRDGSC
jgi:hypothetical protein